MKHVETYIAVIINTKRILTTTKPDFVNPIMLISCVMHEEDLTEKNPIILNSIFDGNSHTSLTH